MLGDAKVDEHGHVLSQKDGTAMYLDKDGEDHEINVRCYFLKFLLLWGKAFLMLFAMLPVDHTPHCR